MEVRISIENGPIKTEIIADEDEQYEEVANELIEFLEEKSTAIENLQESAAPESTNNNASQSSSEDISEGHEMSQVSQRASIDVGKLNSIFSLPEGEEEYPTVFLDEFEEGEEVFGSSRRERQARASMVLLYIWNKELEREMVPTQKLKDALHFAGIDPERTDAMYDAMGGDAERFFESRGAGSGAEIGLTTHGKRKAIDEINRIVNIWEGEDDD